MPRVAPIQQSFAAGEITPLAAGRTDAAQYHQALKTCKNFVPTILGGVMRRPGTYFAAEVKDSSKATYVVRFEFSVTQAYILEFGDLYIRVYKDHGRVEVASVPVEIVTPYVEADLAALKFTQSADVLYIAHPSYAPRKLSRTSHTAWTLTAIDFLDGPYLSMNVGTTTIQPSATTGAGITLTASAALFASTDVGRLVRIRHSSTWGYAKITAYTDSTHVTADVKSDFGAATAQTDWRLGVWSDTTGYPGAVAFYEDRLFFGGATSYPQRLDGSKSGLYENFAPTNAAGTVASDNAVSFTLNSSTVNVIRWLADDEKALLAGTVGGVWAVRPSAQSEALSPTNVSAKRAPGYGAANVQPVRAGSKTMFVQREKRVLRGVSYSADTEGFSAANLSLLSEHITRGGLGQMAWQQYPFESLWAVRGDGALVGMTYAAADAAAEPSIGWHRHILGGSFGSGGAVVESVACIPEPNGTYDELWLVVKRTINGVTKRYIEFTNKHYEEGDAIAAAFYVDCGLTYDGAAATSVTGLSHLEGQTVTVLADGAAHPDCVVSSGAITLARSASVVHAGLGYNSDGESLRFDSGSANGTSQGKTQRIHEVTLRLDNTVELKAGPDFDNLDRLNFRDSTYTTGTAQPPFTGDKALGWPSGYSTEERICFRQDLPLPATILAIMPRMETQDR